MKKPLALAIAAWLALTPAAHAEVHDSLPDLLSAWLDVQEDPNAPWEVAWLRYETAQSAWLDPTLWAGRTPAQKASALDTTMREVGTDFPVRMKELASFEQGWGADLSAVNDGLRREFGSIPLVELYVGFSMSPAKLAIGELGGKPAVCLNARRLLPYRSTATRVLLARYMFEWLVPKWTKASPPSIGDRLHQEGLSVWAAGRILPGTADQALLDVTPDQMAALEAGRARYAAIMLAGLDVKDPQITRRLFGPEPPTGWPPSTGPYVGLLVARDIAQEIGQDKLASISHDEFMTHARTTLHRLAGTIDGK